MVYKEWKLYFWIYQKTKHEEHQINAGINWYIKSTSVSGRTGFSFLIILTIIALFL